MKTKKSRRQTHSCGDVGVLIQQVLSWLDVTEQSGKTNKQREQEIVTQVVTEGQATASPELLW